PHQHIACPVGQERRRKEPLRVQRRRHSDRAYGRQRIRDVLGIGQRSIPQKQVWVEDRRPPEVANAATLPVARLDPPHFSDYPRPNSEDREKATQRQDVASDFRERGGESSPNWGIYTSSRELG